MSNRLLFSLGPRSALLLLIGLYLASSPRAVAQSFQSDDGTARFTSSVPLHEFTGESDHLVGRINLADSTVDFYLDLSTLETGIGKRDRDMRETLEVGEYPFAEFFGKLISDFDIDSAKAQPQPVKVRGVFSIHGVTHQVEIDGTLQKIDDGLRVEAGWELNLNDYSITPPSLLIVKVDEIQKIEIETLLEPE